MQTFLVRLAIFVRDGSGGDWLPRSPRIDVVRGTDLLRLMLAHLLAVVGLASGMSGLAILVVTIARAWS